ncbi:hypothetical protein L1987_09580 [Smallanthus sonchifolius]|uniref:Uncharacterized protein n=1 Tax=Smallanthus sonchifolius TaxID=185202 RepID=A0ACB9JNS0_9ASTR|nr:hypothetical protein L1987_09580 [Smallanthus sonchifolius]
MIPSSLLFYYCYGGVGDGSEYDLEAIVIGFGSIEAWVPPSKSLLLETETVNRIRSDLKKKLGLRLKIVLDTRVVMKIESIRSKKVGIRIKCEDIHSLVTKAGGAESNSSPSSVSATVSDAKCDVDLRIKIWKWTF